jgi:hypothetical protein
VGNTMKCAALCWALCIFPVATLTAMGLCELFTPVPAIEPVYGHPDNPKRPYQTVWGWAVCVAVGSAAAVAGGFWRATAPVNQLD